MCKMCFTEHDIRANMCVHQVKHARLSSFTYDLRSCPNFVCLSYTNACKYTSSHADTTMTFPPLTHSHSHNRIQGWANKHKEQGRKINRKYWRNEKNIMRKKRNSGGCLRKMRREIKKKTQKKTDNACVWDVGVDLGTCGTTCIYLPKLKD